METFPKQTIELTDVTLRDGEQQDKRYDVMPVADRLEVFDAIVQTGIGRIEIGHLGNPHDQDFARQLVGHIAERSGDPLYANVELQVLFGSQKDLTDGIDALDGFDPARIHAHVYDRVSPELRGLATEPYDLRQSADRVADAAGLLQQKGYQNFSISGEGTVDPNISADQAADEFYLPIIARLQRGGAQMVNVNLPNTFGAMLGGEWTEQGLAVFNQRIKAVFPETTTSIHVHNDHNNAVEFSMAALRAGFDRVEGSLTGMGERQGNTALVDVVAQLLESARQVVEIQERGRQASTIGRMAVLSSMWQDRSVNPSLMANLSQWFTSAQTVNAVYQVPNFERTAFGNPVAYAAGSGPHGQANKLALQDPVKYPLWKNYARTALTHAMMGRPEAQEIIAVNSERMRAITLLTHAAGGASRQIAESKIVDCTQARREQAVAIARQAMRSIMAEMSDDAQAAVAMRQYDYAFA